VPVSFICVRKNNSGNIAILTAIDRTASVVGEIAADRWADNCICTRKLISELPPAA
jgi:hypothetical protein